MESIGHATCCFSFLLVSFCIACGAVQHIVLDIVTPHRGVGGIGYIPYRLNLASSFIASSDLIIRGLGKSRADMRWTGPTSTPAPVPIGSSAISGSDPAQCGPVSVP